MAHEYQSFISGNIDHAVISIRFAPHDGGDVAAGIFEDHERMFGEIEFQDCLFLEKPSQAKGFVVHEEGLWLFSFVDFVGKVVEEVSPIVALI